MSGRLTMIPVGAGSPIIVAKNRQSQKPAPTYVLWLSIGFDIILCSLKQALQTFMVRESYATCTNQSRIDILVVKS